MLVLNTLRLIFYFVRERVVNNSLAIHFFSNKDQVADSFTKALPVKKLDEFKCNLNLLKGLDWRVLEYVIGLLFLFWYPIRLCIGVHLVYNFGPCLAPY
jgi:hypothetical protein